MGSWGQFHHVKGVQSKGDGTTVVLTFTFLAYSMCKVAYSLKLEYVTVNRGIQCSVPSTLQVYLNASW